MSKKSKAADSVVSGVQKMSAGLKAKLAGQVLQLSGASVKVDDIIKDADAYVAQVAATREARAAWSEEVKIQRTMEATTIEPRMAALTRYLEGIYGPDSNTLVSFGLTPRKPRPKTVKVKATAVDKALATRAARHTMGPKAKLAIHGTVPASAPHAAAPGPAPAAPAAPVTPQVTSK